MKFFTTTSLKILVLLPLSLVLFLLGGCGGRSEISAPIQPETTETNPEANNVIILTQTGCQFLETEAKNYEFATTKSEDCNRINSQTLSDRQKTFKPLQLKPGKYIFRVTNQNVGYELGFYLRGAGLSQATLPRVSGGGLTQGVTQDYEITLTAGNYVFSCPLNPTPDYPLVVQ